MGPTPPKHQRKRNASLAPSLEGAKRITRVLRQIMERHMTCAPTGGVVHSVLVLAISPTARRAARAASRTSSMAQIMRAILLARATATSISGLHAARMGDRQRLGRAQSRPLHWTIDMPPPAISRRRMSRWPIFEVRPSFWHPPLESCRGTRRSQAAKSRPLRPPPHMSDANVVIPWRRPNRYLARSASGALRRGSSPSQRSDAQARRSLRRAACSTRRGAQTCLSPPPELRLFRTSRPA